MSKKSQDIALLVLVTVTFAVFSLHPGALLAGLSGIVLGINGVRFYEEYVA